MGGQGVVGWRWSEAGGLAGWEWGWGSGGGWWWCSGCLLLAVCDTRWHLRLPSLVAAEVS